MDKINLNNRKIPKRLFTVDEAGVYLGRSATAIREMVWAGKIPYVRFDRGVYIDREDLDKLIEMYKTSFTY